MVLALASAGLTFCSTMFGGLAALRWPARTELLMALAGGVVLGAALFDLLPEAVLQAQDVGMSIRVPIGAVLAGFLVFHVVERFIHRHGDHDHHGVDRPDPAGIAGATGFVIHSFFDGLAIGLGFQIDTGVGLIVTAAVIGHDFSDGLSTVSYLVANNHPESRSRKFLLADAAAPVLGALVATLAPIPDEVFPVALGFFSGLFIYAATANLLPSAHGLPPSRAVPATLAGASAMLVISLFA
jgi:zinc transporter ZupT